MTGQDMGRTPGGLLSDLLSDLPAGQPLQLSDLSDRIGTQGHALLLALIAVPEVVPLVPSASAILGVPLLVIALHLAMFGERRSLPGWLGRRTVPGWLADGLRRRVAPTLDWIERFSRPRWQTVLLPRLAGVACGVMAGFLLLPLPFLNSPPALAIILLGLGLVLRDGVLVALGLVLSVAVAVAIGMLLVTGIDLLAAVLG